MTPALSLKTSSSLIELCRLTELHIFTNKLIGAENLLQITYYNPLRVLVIPNDPIVFSEGYAFEMVENLNHLEELVVEYNHCKSCQLIGTFSLLKKLVIWDIVNHACESCTANPDTFDECAPSHDKIVFDELRKKNQLLELIFCDGCLTESHLDGMADLQSLRLLKFLGTTLPQKVSLGLFKNLINLEELHMDGARRIITEASFEFIRNCQKLRLVHFWYAVGINANFISEANDIISQRKPPPLEPIIFGFSFITADMLIGLLTRFHIRITILKRKYVTAEESYLEMEEEHVSQSNLQGELLKRKFSVMHMVPDEKEVQMAIVVKSDKSQR